MHKSYIYVLLVYCICFYGSSQARALLLIPLHAAEHLHLPGAVWSVVPVYFHGSDVVGF